MDLLAVLLGARALAGISLERDDDLMDQILVVVATEDGLRSVVLGRCLALTAGRTVTKPPFEPGIAPLISSN